MPASKQLHDALDGLPDTVLQRFADLARGEGVSPADMLGDLITRASEHTGNDNPSWLETVSRDEDLVPVAALDQAADDRSELAQVKDELDQIRSLVQDYLTILRPAIQPIQELPEHLNELSKLAQDLHLAARTAGDAAGRVRPDDRQQVSGAEVGEDWTAPFSDTAPFGDHFRN